MRKVVAFTSAAVTGAAATALLTFAPVIASGGLTM